MSSPEFSSLPPEQHVKPGPPVSGPYGSTNYDPEAGTGDDNDGPPLSFADLGIPTGPQIETTVAGKVSEGSWCDNVVKGTLRALTQDIYGP